MLGYSNAHRMIHRHNGLMCHMDPCRLGHLMVDIVVEQVVELVVVELVERLASDLRWLGIYMNKIIDYYH